jgi:TolB-like protein/tetratricopeptide (TPR) repeat protein
VSFIAELKRRNVIRVAILYAVASWLILQVADVLFGLMSLPDWSLRLVLAILILGFPIALIFSWVFELTPEGLKRESDIRPDEAVAAHAAHKLNIATAVLVVVGIGVVAADRLMPEAPQAPAVPQAEAPAGPAVTPAQADAATEAEPGYDPRSIAVLPFENFSGNAEDEYFSDGLSDTVLHQLAQVRELKVIARNSTFQFKGTNLDVREIGERLAVANVLEGSVQRYGGKVRVIAQLVRTSDGAHVWSQSFDYEMDNIFALHDAIAEAVTEQMKVSLLPEDKARLDLGGTDNPTAYDLRMLAQQELYKRFNPSAIDRLDSEEDFLPVQLLRRALELDPDYVDAMADLSRTYNVLAWQTTSAERYDRYLAKSEPLVNRALELAPEYSRVWTVKGGFEHRRGNTDAAIQALRKAVSLNPNDAEAYQVLAVAINRRDSEASIRYMDRLQELDPENTFVRPKVIALERLGRSGEAIALLEAGLIDRPNNELALSDLAGIYYSTYGQPDESARWAARLLELQPDSARGAVAMGRAWNAVGEVERARAWLPRISAGREGSLEVASFEIGLALRDRDFAAARRALQGAKPAEGSRAERSWWETAVILCVLAEDFACADAALDRAEALIEEDLADGRDLVGSRMDMALARAVLEHKRGNDAAPFARRVLDLGEGLRRSSRFDTSLGTRDAEAFVLLGDADSARRALADGLLTGGGYVRYDTFGLPLDGGLVLSELDGDPRFEDFKAQWRARREAARERLIAMEAAGEIPRPTGGAG